MSTAPQFGTPNGVLYWSMSPQLFFQARVVQGGGPRHLWYHTPYSTPQPCGQELYRTDPTLTLTPTMLSKSCAIQNPSGIHDLYRAGNRNAHALLGGICMATPAQKKSTRPRNRHARWIKNLISPKTAAKKHGAPKVHHFRHGALTAVVAVRCRRIAR